ncbi:alpha-mannosyltransferase [Colletotrichum plurivorum]|uniref:Alpha-mannosyltransferase n=1 Tax=Colletotrichum plurivorum TaxID=2175906 RepID=A0A8H6NA49_9PEZI|nr:alpha-mannosyltransferase [Colletotrichum plurivorum]
MAPAHSFLSPRPLLLLFTLLLAQVPLVMSAGIQLWDASPRAAFVSLVSESQLDQMVASVAQLERRFNAKYRYDWVFFSYEELSEEFKDSTSNATAGTVTYNLIPDKHWSPLDSGRPEAMDTNQANSWAAHHKRRWSAGLFAREKRLDAYDWFWMVEPGTQFMCDIDVDVFRLMRDRDIVYGVNQALFQDVSDAKSLWKSAKTFMDEHPDLLQPKADISWILGNDGSLGTPTISAGHQTNVSDGFSSNDQALKANEEAGLQPGVPQEADPQQCEPNTVPDAYTSRLAASYSDCKVDAPIEIGNLRYFRGPEHKSYFEHLDRAGDFHHDTFRNVPIHSLSASMFLPRDRFWLLNDMFYEMHGLRSCPPMPTQTADVDNLDEQSILADLINSALIASQEDMSGLKSLHGVWDIFVVDLERQDKIPAPFLGHTTIDDRNFKTEKWFIELWVKLPTDDNFCPAFQLIFGEDSCSTVPAGHDLSRAIKILERLGLEWLELALEELRAWMESERQKLEWVDDLLDEWLKVVKLRLDWLKAKIAGLKVKLLKRNRQQPEA